MSGIDLPERERRRRAGARDSGGGSDRSGRGARAPLWRRRRRGRPVFLREREDAEDAAHAARRRRARGCGADGVEMRAGVARPGEERERGRRRARRAIGVGDAVKPARRADMLAQQLAGLRIEQADVEVGPLHVDALADPAGRRRVVRGLDFDAAIEMHGAHAEAVVAKRLDGQRLQRGPLLGKHRGDLALGRAVDARVGPVRLPAIEIGLRLLERLEALAVQRRLLRVADAGFDFALAIGIADATRQPDHAVVREHVAIERIERRLVDVGREHAFFEIVEDDRPRRSRPDGETRARGARPTSARSTATTAAAPLCASSASVRTKSRVRRYLPVCGWRTIGPSP